MQEHRTHGEVVWTAYHEGVRIPEGAVQEPEFVVAAIDHPSAEQIERVAARLGLPDDLIARIEQRHTRAVAYRHGGHHFLALRVAAYDDAAEEVRFGEVEIIVSDRSVVLLSRTPLLPTGPFMRTLETLPAQLALGPSAVMHALLDDVVESFEPVILGLENDIDEIEDQVFGEEGDPLRRIHELTREVIAFQRATDPLEAVLATALRRVDLPEGERAFLTDAHELALHASERAAAFRSLLTSVLNVNLALETKRLSEVSNQQAMQSKRVSSWAAILFTPTLIGGIYGMNFDHMPELHWRYGYPFALALMAGVALILWATFRRRDWI